MDIKSLFKDFSNKEEEDTLKSIDSINEKDIITEDIGKDLESEEPADPYLDDFTTKLESLEEVTKTDKIDPLTYTWGGPSSPPGKSSPAMQYMRMDGNIVYLYLFIHNLDSMDETRKYIGDIIDLIIHLPESMELKVYYSALPYDGFNSFFHAILSCKAKTSVTYMNFASWPEDGLKDLFIMSVFDTIEDLIIDDVMISMNSYIFGCPSGISYADRVDSSSRIKNTHNRVLKFLEVRKFLTNEETNDIINNAVITINLKDRLTSINETSPNDCYDEL